jgi:hypothetical protein
MFVHEKKTYYTIQEAYKQTGYKPGTIQDYITKGYIEGERVSGTWALTETGMKQLSIRKSRIEKELKEPAPITAAIKPVRVQTQSESKLIPKKPEKKQKKRTPEPAGTSIKLNTKKGSAVADCLRDLSKITGLTMKELGTEILASGLKQRAALKEKYIQIEQEKKQILEQLRNV